MSEKETAILLPTSSKTVLQQRTILLVGSAGAGKEAIANLIAGFKVFPAEQSQSKTYESTCESQCGNYRYTFKLFETEGNSSDVFRKYFKERKADSVNLLLFVVRKGENHDQDSIGTMIANLDTKVGDYSALVVTACEEHFEREGVLDHFRHNSTFAFFKAKRMFAIGIPGGSRQQNVMKGDEEGLHILVKNSKQQLSAGDAFFAPPAYSLFQRIYFCLEWCGCTIL